MASALKRAPILGECGMDHEVPSAPPSSLLAVPPHPGLGCAGLQNPLPNGLSPRGNALPRALPPRSPLCRTGVRGHPRPGSPKPHEGQPPKAVKGLVLPLHPPSWRCWGARTSPPPPDGAELGHPGVKAGKASRGLFDGPLILASRKASPLLAPLDRNQPGSQAQAAWAAASPRLRGESSSMLWELFLARDQPPRPRGRRRGCRER